jgi:hypothetical protein
MKVVMAEVVSICCMMNGCLVVVENLTDIYLEEDLLICGLKIAIRYGSVLVAIYQSFVLTLSML